MRTFITTVFILFLAVALPAQELKFEPLSIEHRFSCNDETISLWFGTCEEKSGVFYKIKDSYTTEEGEQLEETYIYSLNNMLLWGIGLSQYFSYQSIKNHIIGVGILKDKKLAITFELEKTHVVSSIKLPDKYEMIGGSPVKITGATIPVSGTKEKHRFMFILARENFYRYNNIIDTTLSNDEINAVIPYSSETIK